MADSAADTAPAPASARGAGRSAMRPTGPAPPGSPPIESAGRRPSPTATSVPTRLRTIWCRKALASARISTPPPSAATVSRRRFRTVGAGGAGSRQNEVKSCSPTRRCSGESHRADRERAGTLPHVAGGERIRHLRGVDPVAVLATRCAEPGVEARRGPADPVHGDLRAEHPVQRPLHPVQVEIPRSASNDATCPSACTPASVRPATDSFGSSPSSFPSASVSTPSTVRTCRSRCRAHPRNSVPS